eukprot:CAMPEP_0171465704 /NCGR_PEP_ID=MMETSP0945-20130129/8703_1 /TAXON_ID=109269 /ORGANISM="Vaucheria litorea, Strain CCMP2940" /LENGTH=49 /DNA_ID= /DNA_START= /DNA_END= /DNA_ORIENTATION=
MVNTNLDASNAKLTKCLSFSTNSVTDSERDESEKLLDSFKNERNRVNVK